MALEAPPTWDSIESDPEFQQLSPMEKTSFFSKWDRYARNYAQESGLWDDPEQRKIYGEKAKAALNRLNYDESGNLIGTESDQSFAGKLLDRAQIGLARVAPQTGIVSSEIGALAARTPEIATSIADLLTGDKFNLTDRFRESNKVAQYFQDQSNLWKQKDAEYARAGQNIGGGFAGELAESVVSAGAQMPQDLAFGGAGSIPKALKSTPGIWKSILNQLDSPQIRGVASSAGVRSGTSTLSEAAAQYREESPNLSNEEARNKALPEALLSGASTFLVTTLGGFSGVESILKREGVKGLRSRAANIFKQAASEGLEEGGDQSISDWSERYYRNPDKSIYDSLKEIALAGAAGGILGGMTGAIVPNEKSEVSVLRPSTDPQVSQTEAEILAKADAMQQTSALDRFIAGERIDLPEDADVEAPVNEADDARFAPKSNFGPGTVVSDPTVKPAVSPYSPEGIIDRTDEELNAKESEYAKLVNDYSVANDQEMAELAQEGLDRIRNEKLRRKSQNQPAVKQPVAEGITVEQPAGGSIQGTTIEPTVTEEVNASELEADAQTAPVGDIGPEAISGIESVSDAETTAAQTEEAVIEPSSAISEDFTGDGKVIEPTEVAAPQSQSAAPAVGNKVQLGRSPQTHEIIEELPQTDTEKSLGERYYRVRNTRTGEEQTIELGDIRETKTLSESIRAKIDARKNESGAINAEILAEIADYGRMILQKGMDFTTWSARMIKDLGAKVQPMLRRIWDSINQGPMRRGQAERGAINIGRKREAKANIEKINEQLNDADYAMPPVPAGEPYEMSPAVQSFWAAIIDKGHLPKMLREPYRKLQGRLNAARGTFKSLARDVKVAVERLHPKTALMSLDQRRQVDAARNAEYGRIQMAMTQEDGMKISDLDDTLMLPVNNLRRAIDTLSKIAIDAGIVEGELADAFRSGIGAYMRRGYQVFDPNSGWNYKYLKKHRPELIAAAKKRLMDDDAKMSDVDAEVFIKGLLDRDTASRFMLGGTTTLGKSIGSLLKRNKDLPLEIRELLGEIRDPLINAVRSGDFLAQLIARDEMQAEFAKTAQSLGLISDKKTADFDVPLVDDKITSVTDEDGNIIFRRASNKRHDILRNKWTTREFREAFDKAEQLGTLGQNQGILAILGKFWMSASGFAKLSKTIFSLQSYGPNYLGALVGELFNGRFNPTQLADIYKSLASKDAKLSKAMTSVGFSNGRELYAELLRGGVIDSNISFKDMERTLNRSFLKKARDIKNDPIEKIGGFYSLGDNIGKANAYISEIKLLKKAYPSWDFRKLSDEAARKARETTPNYYEVPKAMRELAQAGVIFQSFINFVMATFRNIAMTYSIGYQEMRSGNPVLARNGAWRILNASSILAFSSYWGLAEASRIFNDIDDEEDEAFRRSFAPDWDKDSNLIYSTSIDGGSITYANSSYIMPHAILTEMATAIRDGRDPGEAALGAIQTLASNLIDDGLLFGTVASVLANQKNFGKSGDLVNPEKDTEAQWATKAWHIWEKAFEPGVVTQGRRAYKGIIGESGDNGREYSVKEELYRVAGYRANTINPEKALTPKFNQLNARYRNAKSIAGSAEKRGWKGEKLEGAKIESQESVDRVIKDWQQLIDDAKTLKVPTGKIRQTLKDTSVPIYVREKLKI